MSQQGECLHGRCQPADRTVDLARSYAPVAQHGLITGELRRCTLVRTIGTSELLEPMTDGTDELIKLPIDDQSDRRR